LEPLLPAPQQVATLVGMDARDIRRLSREFAASKGGLAVAGGVATQYASGAHVLVASVNLLNYVAGQVGKTVKFGPNHALEAAAGRCLRAATTRNAARFSQRPPYRGRAPPGLRQDRHLQGLPANPVANPASAIWPRPGFRRVLERRPPARRRVRRCARAECAA